MSICLSYSSSIKVCESFIKYKTQVNKAFKRNGKRLMNSIYQMKAAHEQIIRQILEDLISSLETKVTRIHTVRSRC